MELHNVARAIRVIITIKLLLFTNCNYSVGNVDGEVYDSCFMAGTVKCLLLQCVKVV